MTIVIADARTTIKRLEMAIAILNKAEHDMSRAMQMTESIWQNGCPEDANAIGFLMIVARQGIPLHWIYECECGAAPADFWGDDEEPDLPF